MRTAIEVKSKAEGDSIKKGLADPVTRAVVIMTGLLSDLTTAQCERVLRNVKETLEDPAK